jgi:hypothetical protein
MVSILTALVWANKVYQYSFYCRPDHHGSECLQSTPLLYNSLPNNVYTPTSRYRNQIFAPSFIVIFVTLFYRRQYFLSFFFSPLCSYFFFSFTPVPSPPPPPPISLEKLRNNFADGVLFYFPLLLSIYVFAIDLSLWRYLKIGFLLVKIGLLPRSFFEI